MIRSEASRASLKVSRANSSSHDNQGIPPSSGTTTADDDETGGSWCHRAGPGPYPLWSRLMEALRNGNHLQLFWAVSLLDQILAEQAFCCLVFSLNSSGMIGSELVQAYGTVAEQAQKAYIRAVESSEISSHVTQLARNIRHAHLGFPVECSWKSMQCMGDIHYLQRALALSFAPLLAHLPSPSFPIPHLFQGENQAEKHDDDSENRTRRRREFLPRVPGARA